MTLPSPQTALAAVRFLARTLNEGMRYARSGRMEQVREHYLGQLREQYEATPPVTHLAHRPLDLPPEEISLKATHNLNVLFPEPAEGLLPADWRGRFYEHLRWPPEDTSFFKQPHQPFRTFLEITRGSAQFKIPVHDVRDPWTGPSFKARAKLGFYPLSPAVRVPLSTYMVWGERLSDQSICRWLTVILAQRELLTDEEEEECVMAFFAGRDDRRRPARLAAYMTMKKQFVQPLRGQPSFPTYYRKTVKGHLAAEWAAEHSAEPERWVDGSSVYISLRGLRRSEPALHRAVLDRIRRGKLKAVVRRGMLFLKTSDLDRVDQERIRNTKAKIPKAHPDRRVVWITKLMAANPQISRDSATRKLKRWINTLALSSEDVEASITRGRLTRISRSHSTR